MPHTCALHWSRSMDFSPKTPCPYLVATRYGTRWLCSPLCELVCHQNHTPPSSLPRILIAVICSSRELKGGTVNGASPAYGEAEMTSALKTAHTRFIMAASSCIQVVLAAAKAAGIPRDRIFLLEGRHDDLTTISELIDIGREYGRLGQSPIFRVPPGKTNDICGFLTFSSGTTGFPKAVSVILSYLKTDRILGLFLVNKCRLPAKGQ